MKLKFTKMHGCGNDYIYFDCFEQDIKDPAELSVRLSKPHFGIGGDGIILICPSQTADAKMRIFNLDGSEGKMCGNGIRCVGKYLYDSGRVQKTPIAVETLSGMKLLHLTVEQGAVASVAVEMGKAEFSPEKIPARLEGTEIVARKVEIGGREETVTCVSMGNPHCVVFRDDIESLDLEEEGKRFEHHPIFPEGVNTEFVRVVNPRLLQMRVWERGSGETLACGTGACAAAAAAVKNGYSPSGTPITVQLLGGSLDINYTEETVWMTGEAKTVFTGEVDV
ncbi:diaminopimelate epimerase [Massiliimalia massiliensis]|uniref:diaminopimelate epimerase n=1 Tax=Massiliimalia massiliensis TaxID=1852384 RepID=UPI000986F6C2|nr:diaminopimelate epimerase [Massiliimalia massiliensis]MBS1473867.1 diaminopimelate epimerase [Massiliimalia sp.]